jgi:exopolyphosphatase/guanosine-5'-triphosphate,3'-diphosphate pyrophosphatase
MPWVTRAVIDVGTNSVKLLVAEIKGQEVNAILEESEQTRLGQGFYDTHQLRRENIENTAVAVARFVGLAKHWGAQSTLVFATSAARDASNGQELITSIERASGLKLRVISGEQEADWVFCGVTSDPALADQNLVVMDLGGGSTEFIVGRDDKREFAQSFQIGTVRLLEKFRPSNPPKRTERIECEKYLQEFLASYVRPAVEPHLHGATQVQLVGTGGTANILARMEKRLDKWERKLIDGNVLPIDAIREQKERLWRLPLEERRRLPGLPPQRADVILFGAAIYCAVMEQFGFPTVKISTRGLRYAALLEGQ